MSSRKTTPPLSHEIRAYVREIGYPDFNVEQFMDHWEMRAWEVRPGIKCKSWRAAVRTWLRNQARWAREQGQPGPCRLSPADQAAIADYTRQAAAIIRQRRGEGIGRLYRKIADSYGEQAVESVRAAVKKVNAQADA